MSETIITPENTTSQIHPDLYRLLVDFANPETREGALLELAKRRDEFPNIAPIIWHTSGTIACLVKELIDVYVHLNPPNKLSTAISNRVCNAIAIIQCIASHPEGRLWLIESRIPLLLFVFLSTTSKHKTFEYLRLTSLGVIGALVKSDDPFVIKFLLTTEIIPLCLRIMEGGTELSRTVSVFVIQKIMMDEGGLSYICANSERFHAVSVALVRLIAHLSLICVRHHTALGTQHLLLPITISSASVADNEIITEAISNGEEPPLSLIDPDQCKTPLSPQALQGSTRLLRHVIKCYHRFSTNSQVRTALVQVLPRQLKDKVFINTFIQENESMMTFLEELISNVESVSAPVGGWPSTLMNWA